MSYGATSTTGGTIHVHEPLAASLIDVGIFKDTLFPTFALNAGISVLAYAAGRATNNVATKDIAFPASIVFSAWWSAAGRRWYHYGLPVEQVLRMQSRPEKLLLTGITLWGGYKLLRAPYGFYRRGGDDDPKYSSAKAEEGFWNKAILNTYLPEALIATIVSLPVTAPFRHQGAVLSGYHPIIQSIAVGLYTAGFALDVTADMQRDEPSGSGTVWDALSTPKAIAAAATTLSFPILLYSSDMLAPIELLGPIAYYFFARYRYSSQHSPQDDVEKVKATAEDVKEGQVDYKQEANEAKDDIVKAFQNKGVLMTLGLGVVVGLIEGFVHGPHGM